MKQKTIITYLSLEFLVKFFFSFHAAIYVSYLLQNDLTLLEVGFVNFAFMLSVFIFEMPTGAIADLFGRKISFVLSNILTGMGFLLYGATRNFTGFIVSEIIIAIGMTLKSGAFEAWLVDSLKHYKWDGKLIQVFHSQGRVENVAKLLGGIIGAYIGTTSLALPFTISGVATISIGFISYFIMKEDYFTKALPKKGHWQSLVETARKSVQYGMKHKTIFLVLTVIIVMTIAVQPLNMYWQPHFRPYLSGNQYLGFIWAGIVVFNMIGNETVKWFSKKFQNIKIGYSIIGISMGSMIIIASFSVLSVSLLGYMAHEIVRGLQKTYTRTIVQENIPSQTRSTIQSFISMAKTGAAGIGLLVFGLMANMLSICMAWIIAGLMIIFILPFIIMINGKICIKKT